MIGATAHTIEEADRAVAQGADYLGIGTIFPTSTYAQTSDADLADVCSKKDAETIIGADGLALILDYLRRHAEPKYCDIKTVCIGGINQSNIDSLLRPTLTNIRKHVDGVAMISAIISSGDPCKAAGRLSTQVDQMKLQLDFARDIVHVFQRLAATRLRVHHMSSTALSPFHETVARSLYALLSWKQALTEAAALFLSCRRTTGSSKSSLVLRPHFLSEWTP